MHCLTGVHNLNNPSVSWTHLGANACVGGMFLILLLDSGATLITLATAVHN
jgi:hypothetical protein